MKDEAFYNLAKVLDTLPNGFPSTDSGVEIKVLKAVFNPEEADLFCDLKLTPETAEQIAERTGRSMDGLEELLLKMWEHGQIFSVDLGGIRIYKMLPWLWGIYEFQVDRMDKEMAELFHEYYSHYGPQFFSNKPQYPLVVPIEKEMSVNNEALPYGTVSAIIESGGDWAVNECVCRKEHKLVGKGCDHPIETCLGIAPVSDVFSNSHWGRPISKQEAYEVLKQAEEAGLVHVTSNFQKGRIYICNCCGCCCGFLGAMNQLNIQDAINSMFYAEIDQEACTACGLCYEERCQVNAILVNDDEYSVVAEKCIGCGLCITTCPSEAVKLLRKEEDQIVHPPNDENEWFEMRGKYRGVDYSNYK